MSTLAEVRKGIETLTEDELLQLNSLIADKISYLRKVDAVTSMREFSVGDKVKIREETLSPTWC